jgi:hypothetical protein
MEWLEAQAAVDEDWAVRQLNIIRGTATNMDKAVACLQSLCANNNVEHISAKQMEETILEIQDLLNLYKQDLLRPEKVS